MALVNLFQKVHCYDSLLRLTACLLAVNFGRENSNALKYHKVVGVTSHTQCTVWNKSTSKIVKMKRKICNCTMLLSTVDSAFEAKNVMTLNCCKCRSNRHESYNTDLDLK